MCDLRCACSARDFFLQQVHEIIWIFSMRSVQAYLVGSTVQLAQVQLDVCLHLHLTNINRPLSAIHISFTVLALFFFDYMAWALVHQACFDEYRTAKISAPLHFNNTCMSCSLRKWVILNKMINIAILVKPREILTCSFNIGLFVTNLSASLSLTQSMYVSS